MTITHKKKVEKIVHIYQKKDKFESGPFMKLNKF